MLYRLIFAFAIGVVFTSAVLMVVDMPYSWYVALPGAAVLGWFSDVFYDKTFGVR